MAEDVKQDETKMVAQLAKLYIKGERGMCENLDPDLGS